LLDNLDFGVGLFWSPNTLWTYIFLVTNNTDLSTDLMIDDGPMKNF